MKVPRGAHEGGHMGEAKRRRMAGPRPVSVVYHHTSVLRTNLIWMSGVIQVEGACGPVLHPQLGEIRTDANLRREMTDFPPLAWFTSQVRVPNCLQDFEIAFTSKADGSVLKRMRTTKDVASGLSLRRLALGFPMANSTIVPWKEHPGYGTAEGQSLNETAREIGDDPDEWWVSEQPIGVMSATEVWIEGVVGTCRLKRHEGYLSDIKRMVTMCQTHEGAFIPPAWLPNNDAVALARRMGLPVMPLAPS
jgi:hypothetical protein